MSGWNENMLYLYNTKATFGLELFVFELINLILLVLVADWLSLHQWNSEEIFCAFKWLLRFLPYS